MPHQEFCILPPLSVLIHEPVYYESEVPAYKEKLSRKTTIDVKKTWSLQTGGLFKWIELAWIPMAKENFH